jgi:phosphate starvation-inducible PhoH-like protein
VVPKTAGQQRYVQTIHEHAMVFGIGPAGTGKTYLAMALAVEALLRGDVSRIILTRPAVEAGERLGYLPGDLAEKITPYLRPLYDALYEMIEETMVQRYIERGIIQVAPLAYMRGRTLNESFIILDEAQNTTGEQMKMFLTRMGNNSKVVITGDVTQIDLPPEKRSGLLQAREVLSNVTGIAFVELTAEDVVRHPLVAAIVNAYQQARDKGA